MNDRYDPDQLRLWPGEREKEKGMSQVLGNTPTSYLHDVLDVVARLCRERSSFTVEDVRQYSGTPPHHHNALGACMAEAHRLGLIKVIRYEKSKRKDAHARVIPVYVGLRK